MFTAQDIVDNRVTLFFPSQCEWCSLVNSEYSDNYRPTKYMSITHFHKEMLIKPPYVYFTTCDSDAEDQDIEAYIWYKKLLLKTDQQFLFDSNLGIPFIIALEDLWLRSPKER